MKPALLFIRGGQEQNTREVKHHVCANGKREFVPRDQVSPFVVYCSLFIHIN